MFRQRTSSVRVHSFRPAIETLEDRTLLSAFGDLLEGLYQDINHTSGSVIVKGLPDKTNNDVAAVQQNPNNLGAVMALADDVGALQATASNLVVESQLYINFLRAGQNAGLVTPDEVGKLEDHALLLLTAAAFLQNAAEVADQDLQAAAFAFFDGTTPNLTPIPTGTQPTTTPTPTPPTPTPTPPPPTPTPTPPPPTPTPTPTLNSFVVPTSPTHGDPVTVTATISGEPVDTLVTLSISGSDGYTNANTTKLYTGSGTATLDIPGGAAGVTDTITLTAPGITTPPKSFTYS